MELGTWWLDGFNFEACLISFWQRFEGTKGRIEQVEIMRF